MSLRLYNTLTRVVEPFEPLRPGVVTMYTCGPTVWNYAHIGNFRTFLFEDLLRRWLEASGYRVFHIMNLTDVDDRIIAEAGKRGITIDRLVEPFVTAFFEDRDYLRIRPAHEYPRATGFIAPMVALVQGLLDQGSAYRGDDGSVYFSIARFPAYGRLSQLDRRELKAGASERVSSDEYAKEDARDWVLWKAAKPEDERAGAVWDAPFGRGRPGWHLECSAMALELLERQGLGRVLDIHAGGVDLIFPHHEDEIAQSCAFTGEELFARFWLHGEFLNLRGSKMSKRFGNITTPRDLREDGVDPAAIRLLMFQTHYRQKLDLTDEGLLSAREGARRLGEFHARLAEAPAGAESTEFEALAARFTTEFRASLDDDLNGPQAVAALFELVRDGNRLLDEGRTPGAAIQAAWRLQNEVLGVLPTEKPTLKLAGTEWGGAGAALSSPATPSEVPPAESSAVEGWVRDWAERRRKAKKEKNFTEADRIRDLLRRSGFEVRDTREGSIEIRRLDTN